MNHLRFLVLVVLVLHGAPESVRAVEPFEELFPPANLKTGLIVHLNSGDGEQTIELVLHDGLLYAIDDRGIFSVLEAKTGKLVYEERLELGGTHYPSVSVAGNNVYLSSDNGTTLVAKTGPKFEIVGRNHLEPFRSSLVFEGKRMYVRTQKNLYCIGE